MCHRFPSVVLIALLLAPACASSHPRSSDRVTNVEEPAVRRPLKPNPEYLIPGGTRTFEIHYVAHVSDVPPGTKVLRVWLPVPSDSDVQKISHLTFHAPVKPQMTHDPRYHDRIAYFVIAEPPAKLDLGMRFVCTRKVERVDLSKLSVDGTDPKGMRKWLQPDRLVVVNDKVKRIAEAVTEGCSTTLSKAHAIYEYVLHNMDYDKSGTGWGRGDTMYACESGRGNCTDFHSLFISLCRSVGIESGFEIGLYLPYETGKREKVGGYHCWAYFRVPGKTWVPVDISEAWKNPKLARFFFGGHTDNRVTLSVGRDIVLSPPQAGPPLNYFLKPYAEADGRPLTTSKSWSYEDE